MVAYFAVALFLILTAKKACFNKTCEKNVFFKNLDIFPRNFLEIGIVSTNTYLKEICCEEMKS
jgi:hypothetical protein